MVLNNLNFVIEVTTKKGGYRKQPSKQQFFSAGTDVSVVCAYISYGIAAPVSFQADGTEC